MQCIQDNGAGGFDVVIPQPVDITQCVHIATSNAEYNAIMQTSTFDFELYGINPETILSVLGFGFAFIILMWSFGYTIGVATGVIKKV